jgi:hypothetical protein
MVGMKIGDPHKIVMGLLTRYVRGELDGADTPTKTAEALSHLLAGIRVSRLYRRDVPEQARNSLAREYLRGILTDHRAI